MTEKAGKTFHKSGHDPCANNGATLAFFPRGFLMGAFLLWSLWRDFQWFASLITNKSCSQLVWWGAVVKFKHSRQPLGQSQKQSRHSFQEQRRKRTCNHQICDHHSYVFLAFILCSELCPCLWWPEILGRSPQLRPQPQLPRPQLQHVALFKSATDPSVNLSRLRFDTVVTL